MLLKRGGKNGIIWTMISPEIARTLLILILFLQLPEMEGQPHTALCARIDPSQIPYEYDKAGDVTIGAIVTQFACLFDEMSFTEDPKLMILNEL